MKRLAFICITLLILVFPAITPVGADDGISVFYSTDIVFPHSLTFNFTAASSSDITHIELRYKLNKISTVNLTTVVQPNFIPAQTVDTGWTWDMRKMLTSSLPPGAEILYSWRIIDSSGVEFESSWESVIFDDGRYAWNSLSDEFINLFWYEGDTTFAQDLLDTANEVLQRLSNDAGATLEQPVKIYVYSDSEELQNAILYPQEWLGGVSFSPYSTIAIGTNKFSLSSGKRLLSHELAHIVTFQMTLNPYNDIPVWLSEGLSMYAEGDLRLNMEYALDRAIASDSLISLKTISSNFPVDYDQAFLSYAESYSVIEFLINEYDADKMLELLSVFKQGSSYDAALIEVYGVDTMGLNNLWRESLGLEPLESSPTITPFPPPTPEPDSGPFGCRGSSASADYSYMAVFITMGLLLMPGISLLIGRISCRGKSR